MFMVYFFGPEEFEVLADSKNRAWALKMAWERRGYEVYVVPVEG